MNAPEPVVSGPIRSGGLVLIVLIAGVARGEEVRYGRDVKPILAANCFACHGPDAAARKGDLRLDTREGATAERGGLPAIVPGDPEASELVARVEETDPELMMPPAKSGHTLTDAQKRTLREWVRQGADYEEHWSFRPLVRPAVPEVEGAAHPIDAFVLERLARAGLRPEPEAGRATLLRRVSLDLIGLPPTPAEVDAFVADRSPDAYEKVVDRLLASPRFGEHWARMWLDLARYADTKGYEKDQPRTMWRYRDWVIAAFNADMPYDRFTIEQLAGDLLPGATESQRLATAFHRNTMTNDEGGTDDEEFRVAAVKDRVDTTVQVWMGLTMGCAKCHSHKYDPITQRDYYRFYAVFNQTEDADRYDDAPTEPMPTADQAARLAALEARQRELEAACQVESPEREERRRAWEAALAREVAWTSLAFAEMTSAAGATFAARGDGAVVVSGTHGEKDVYTLRATLPPGRWTALRLEVLKDDSLPGGGPGREASDPNAVVSELTVEVRPDADGAARPVKLVKPRADHSQGGYEVERAVDGDPGTGWAYAPQNGKPHVLVCELAEPVEVGDGATVTIAITQNYPKLQLGCFRVAVSGAEPGGLKAELRPLAEIVALEEGRRTAEDRRRLDEAFGRQDEATREAYQELDRVKADREALAKQVARTPVMRELPPEKRRATHVHPRGNFLEKGEAVEPGVLEAFGPLPEGAAADRLGAARWLMSDSNPLTARVAVNRVWARLFGTGLVETEEDFGAQGTPPTHPELLDWLAARFRDELGWSMKGLCRTIVTSATYRQAARQDPGKVEADPRNALYARGARFRLPAEVVRDQALAAAGLLSAKLGGPSVMPPQPPGLWKAAYSSLKWETSPGEDRHRRGLYTFWRRTSPHPAMTTFDAGSGEVCTIRRVRTNTPLQALVTLNDPAMVEAAGALGRRMREEGGTDARARVAWGMRLVLARQATEVEVERLASLWAEAEAEYRADPAAARALCEAANLSVGEATAVEAAAGTVVGNVILNLDEAVMRP